MKHRELLELLENIRDDLRIRADVDSDGKNVINLSHHLWLDLKQQIEILEAESLNKKAST